jgi:hypothetical protein
MCSFGTVEMLGSAFVQRADSGEIQNRENLGEHPGGQAIAPSKRAWLTS